MSKSLLMKVNYLANNDKDQCSEDVTKSGLRHQINWYWRTPRSCLQPSLGVQQGHCWPWVACVLEHRTPTSAPGYEPGPWLEHSLLTREPNPHTLQPITLHGGKSCLQ